MTCGLRTVLLWQVVTADPLVQPDVHVAWQLQPYTLLLLPNVDTVA